MTEQNRDATEYLESAIKVCRCRLELLAKARARGIHSYTEYARLVEMAIAETEQAWDVSLDDLRELS